MDPGALNVNPADEGRPESARLGALGWLTLALLLLGGLVIPVAGWLIGIVLLWTSKLWTTNQKSAATFILPGGLALPIYGGISVANALNEGRCATTAQTVSCTGGDSRLMQILIAAAIVAGIGAVFGMVGYLATRAERPAQ